MKTVLYLGGGAMTGVYGSGVVSKLQDLNIYNELEAVYGGSAGSMSGAFFLTKQAHMGSSIYWEDLQTNFVMPENVFKVMVQRFRNKNYSGKDIKNIVDIDYVLDVIKKKRKIKLTKLINIPFFTPVVNLKTKKLEYLDIHKVPEEILRAAISIVPYWHSSGKIEDIEYIDGAATKQIGLKYLLKKYPKSKIVLVLNDPPTIGVGTHIRKYVEGFFAGRMYGKFLRKLYKGYIKSLKEDLKLMDNNQVFVVYPKNHEVRQWTKDKNKIKKLYVQGRTDAEKIVKFILS